MIPKYLATLAKIEQLTPTVKEFTFNIDKTFTFKTGQWVMLEIPANGETIKRAMSIASPSSTTDKVNFCVKKIEGGKGSTALHTLKEGQTIHFTGPFGIFTLKYPLAPEVIMIATGSGISPFKAMLLDLLEKQKASNEIYLLFGNRTEDEIIYREFFESLTKKHPHFHFIPILSKPDLTWKGEIGRVQALIKKYVKSENKDKQFYLCGMKEMILSSVELLETMGFSRDKIHFERYN